MVQTGKMELCVFFPCYTERQNNDTNNVCLVFKATVTEGEVTFFWAWRALFQSWDMQISNNKKPFKGLYKGWSHTKLDWKFHRWLVIIQKETNENKVHHGLCFYGYDLWSSIILFLELRSLLKSEITCSELQLSAALRGTGVGAQFLVFLTKDAVAEASELVTTAAPLTAHSWHIEPGE